MKDIILILIYLFIISNSYCQNKKEIVFLLFDNNNRKTCKVETEFSYDNDGNLDGYMISKKYRKKHKKDKTIFYICNEKFIFNTKKQKKDTCSINYLEKINVKNVKYIKDKYQKSKDFKHQTFKQINIIEKISDSKVIKYYDVYWCCEWSIE